jgi:uncharacterized protein
MRQQARPGIALIVFVLYLIAFYGVWIINGVDYNRIGDDATTIAKWYVAPLAAGSVVLIIAVSAMGWWRPVLFEREKATPRWLLIGPILMALTAVVFLLSKDYSNTTTTMVLLLVIGSIGVGFGEEVATRGVLLTGFRGRFTEPWVWFWSTALFGLLHLPNAFFGAGISAVAQVFLAFGGGTMFYILRRVSGTLIWAMLLHGFWDFASFIGDGGGGAAALVFVNGAIALVLVWVLLRRERGLRIVPLGAEAEKQPA